MLRILKTGTGDPPVLVCDHCNQHIEDIGMAAANVQEREASRREYGI